MDYLNQYFANKIRGIIRFDVFNIYLRNLLIN